MAVFPSTRVPLVGSSLWADALPKSGGPEKSTLVVVPNSILAQMAISSSWVRGRCRWSTGNFVSRDLLSCCLIHQGHLPCSDGTTLICRQLAGYGRDPAGVHLLRGSVSAVDFIYLGLNAGGTWTRFRNVAAVMITLHGPPTSIQILHDHPDSQRSHPSR